MSASPAHRPTDGSDDAHANTTNPSSSRLNTGIFARKGTAAPLVDKLGGAEAPEEVVAENHAARRSRAPVSRDDLEDHEITIINERSVEAGYPQNPSPEELAAMEAERDMLDRSRGAPWLQAGPADSVDCRHIVADARSAHKTEDWGAMLAPAVLAPEALAPAVLDDPDVGTILPGTSTGHRQAGGAVGGAQDAPL